MRFGKLAILSAAAVLALAPLGYAKHGHGPSNGHGSAQGHGNAGDHGHGGPGGENGHGGGKQGGGSTCEAARCEVAGSLDTTCPCGDFTNHGQYVRCVAHAVKALTSDGTLSKRCKGKLVRCAAHSVCGKGDAIPCLVPTDVCNLTTLTCTADPTVPCAADLDCGGSCDVADSADACAAAGGAPAGAISCCAPCVGSASGAFLD